MAKLDITYLRSPFLVQGCCRSGGNGTKQSESEIGSHALQNQNQNQNYIINWDHLANAGYFTGFPEQEKKRKRNLSMQSDISTIARKAKKV